MKKTRDGWREHTKEKELKGTESKRGQRRGRGEEEEEEEREAEASSPQEKPDLETKGKKVTI